MAEVLTEATEPLMARSDCLVLRSGLEAMTCLAVVILVGEAGDCPLTDTGLSYESIVGSGSGDICIDEKGEKREQMISGWLVVRKLLLLFQRWTVWWFV